MAKQSSAGDLVNNESKDEDLEIRTDQDIENVHAIESNEILFLEDKVRFKKKARPMTVHNQCMSKEPSIVRLDDSLLNVVDTRLQFKTRDGSEDKSRKRLKSAISAGFSRDLHSANLIKSRIKVDQSVSSTSTLINEVRKLNFNLAKVPSATKKHFI